MRFLSAGYALAIYGFIFLPVVVLVVFSLQSTAFPIPPFTGPSSRWYEAVLNDPRLTSALLNSLAVADHLFCGGSRTRLRERLGLCPLRAARLGSHCAASSPCRSP